ncbi:MAG: hypothetical protein KJ808_00250 [Acidobacteria bacterium]|nr:hypothetical protein [Acidobacteriota bacterium]MBU4307842.1 hypothetical protein [Acidobacteriota bacterium]MBU4404437.1 hypothetical protein [Acidobacteriota bacterium]MCG2811373.1 hypothetical protein [Candidatus Aminicenantes bacterium]
MANQRFSFQSMRENARIAGAEKSRKRQLLFHFTIAGVAFAISLLYQAMRPIMRLGGMVAAGGPYAIEHPAPSWVWIMPVSILFGMACFFINLFCRRPEAVNLMPLAWPGLFLSLGWNFLEFALAPPGGGLAWGWLICGMLFVLMGGLPLLLAFKPAREKIRSRLQNGEGLSPYAFQWLLVAGGVYLGIVFFRSVVG